MWVPHLRCKTMLNTSTHVMRQKGRRMNGCVTVERVPIKLSTLENYEDVILKIDHNIKNTLHASAASCNYLPGCLCWSKTDCCHGMRLSIGVNHSITFIVFLFWCTCFFNLCDLWDRAVEKQSSGGWEIIHIWILNYCLSDAFTL